jgi:hypothetical protein
VECDCGNNVEKGMAPAKISTAKMQPSSLVVPNQFLVWFPNFGNDDAIFKIISKFSVQAAN